MAVAKFDDRIIVSGTSADPIFYTLTSGKTYIAAQYAGNGGALAVESYGTVTGENVTFSKNLVLVSDGKVQGGAIYNGSTGELNLTGATFTSNGTSATTSQGQGQGGAIYNYGKAVLTDATFTGNHATQGGAIFNNGGALDITNATFSGNDAKYGGAIQTFGGGTLNITSAQFIGNTGKGDGGAIAHYKGTATISGTTFSGNTARSTGGALYNTGTLNLADTTFDGNKAKSGGAIFNTTSGTINMTGNVTLATANDDLYNAGTLNWDLTGGANSHGTITGYQYLVNAEGTLTITVGDNQDVGAYTIATGDLSSLDGKQSFMLTGFENGQSAIVINGDSVVYNDRKYTLATDDNGTAEDLTDDTLVLTVAAPPASVANAAIAIDGAYTYNGEAQTVTLTVKMGDETLVMDTDYTLTYANNVNAGTATVTITGIGNYTGTKDATFTISQKVLTVDGTTASGKTYDGTTAASVNAGELVGVVGTDDVSVTATGEFDDKNAGNGKDVSITYTLTGDDAANYTVAAGTTTADIAAKSLTVTGTAADGKTYDGTTAAAIGTVGTLAGAIDGDDVAIGSATGEFDDKNAGNGKDVSITYTLTGDDAANYTVAAGTTTADIAAKSLTVTGTAADGKTYDGTTTATIGTVGTLAGAIDGDDVAIGSATGEFDDKNAGNGKDVSIIYTLTGDDAANYTVAAGTTTADIAAKSLTVTGTAADGKTYDGTTAATIGTVGTLAGAIDGDDVAIGSATGEFDDKNAGNGKDVSITYTLTGDDAANYTVASGTTTADIAAKSLTVTGTAADGKTYDGTTAATIRTVGTLAGAIDGDDVAIGSATGEFDDKNAGNGKDVSITYTLTGDDAANYTVAAGTTTADIAKRSVTLTSADATKEYNGEALTNDTVNVSGDNWVNGEGATYDVTGSQTDVGSSDNTFTYTLYENTSAENYNISAIEGVLTVTEAQENPPGGGEGGEGGDTPPDKPDGGGEGGEGGGGDTPPDKPDGGGEGGGGDTPPDKPDGGGEGGGEGGGGSEETVTLKGVLQIDSGTEIRDGGDEGATLASTASDENVVLVQNGASLTISHYTLSKSGDCSSEDNSNFLAVNAVVAAKSAAKIYIDNSELTSNAEGANGLFASGEGSTIYAYNCTITSTSNSSRGLDATYLGTVIASKMTITTSGQHCAALATDRGDGYISVTNSTLSTAGNGSPLIYSTGTIEVDNVTGTSTGSQIAGIEGLSTIRIKNSSLSGSGEKAIEPVANGVIIYQSMSGDSQEGQATFEVADSTLKSAINGGAMFYITNTSAVITVQNTTLDFDSDNNYLIMAAGNDGSNGWGTAGANGATVVFTAIDQTLAGNVSVDGISSLEMYLINSDYTGTFVLDTTYTGNGGADVYISEDSTWTVTGNCTLQTLTVTSGAQIVDGSGKTVSIVNTSGETLVSGTSALTITVSTYTSKKVEAVHAIQDFEIDRSAFEEMYAEEEPLPAITIIAASADKMYDGSALSNAGYTFTDGVLADGDILTATVEGSITDAGTASNKVTSYKVMRGTEDVTSQYTFNDSVDGTLTVTKRDVTLTSASDSKEYDGTALANDTITVSGSGFVSGQGATYAVTGTQTEVGSSSNTFTYTLNAGTNGENYDIHTVAGTLSVTPVEITAPQIKECVNDGIITAVSWLKPAQSEYVDVALNAADASDGKLLVRTDGTAIELYSVPENYELSVKDTDSSSWSSTVQVSGTAAENATAIVSTENDIAELFFVNVTGTWSAQYQAHHVGSIQDWNGTDEWVALEGKNIVADTFTGSSDANMMLLTDDTNGDSLFVDDIFTAFPDERQARIAQIDEIRAGAGDDVVDMTSQLFEYVGDGLTIRGGSGDDTIWANKGSNQLFGDAGNDRIVGASGNDVIVGGTGNDSMHGGGGNDTFCFCDNWGEDTVEQLAGGKVTLWFASGSENNWDQKTMTYTDGDNSVKVTGASNVTLKFGDDDSEQYDALLANGAFMEESSDKIFATEQKGVLATL